MAVQTEAAASPKAVLVHGPGTPLAALDAVLEAEGIRTLSRSDFFAAVDVAADAPTVLVVDSGMVAAGALGTALDALPPAAVAVAADDATAAVMAAHERMILTLPQDADGALRALRLAFRFSATRLATARLERELDRSRFELRELNRIGMALMTEREPDRLLARILDQALALTHSDAGSLYLVEKDEQGSRRLRFKLSRNDSLPDLPFTEFTLPLDPASLAGYAASTGESLSLEDVYALDPASPFRFNRGFDERFGYRTKSMLVVPMKDHRDDVVGVLQLINRKTWQEATITSDEAAAHWVAPYSEHELELLGSLAGQAAISIENSELYRQIQTLFDSFVKAAVTAIDQRDPTTSGHSLRVASLTTDLAEALQRNPTPAHRGVRFTAQQMRELRYASLLHDFGKVGVREEVLVKAKKLPPFLYERVESRFHLVRRTVEAEYHRRRAEYLAANGRRAYESIARRWEEEFTLEMERLDRFHRAVRESNEPTVLPEAAAEILQEVAGVRFQDVEGGEVELLSNDELHFLRIPRGTLDESERLEIESHVEQTYQFLSQIPWTEDLRDVAAIAYGHHEKLNGRGYPRKLSAPEIPVQTRIMTIADIFDALTASDRPYKKALPYERALSILEMEAKDGLVDAELVGLLVESQVYRKILDLDWTEL